MTEQPRFTAQEFRRQLAAHKLMGARCTDCGAIYVPPRPVCPECLNAALEWVELSGAGQLVAYTVIVVAPTMMLEAGYGRKNPYCTGVVALAEGPRVSAQILGVDVAHPESIHIGQSVKVVFIERGEGETRRTFLGFAPLSD